jgi:cytochrome c
MGIKKLLIISIAFAITSCGSNNSSSTEQTTAAATAEVNTEDISNIDMFKSSDCGTCHRRTEAFSGPSFTQIAAKYPNAADTTIANLAGTIINGSRGKWKDFVAEMTPHPALTKPEAENMVKYILDIKNK